MRNNTVALSGMAISVIGGFAFLFLVAVPTIALNSLPQFFVLGTTSMLIMVGGVYGSSRLLEDQEDNIFNTEQYTEDDDGDDEDDRYPNYPR